MKVLWLVLFLLLSSLAYGYELGLVPSGVIPQKEQRDFSQEQSSAPSHLNWEDYLSEVRDQGSCGSCVTFSILGAMEARIRIQEDSPDLNIDLSEQDVVSCGPKGSTHDGCNGNTFEKVCSYLHQDGVVSEECFPYEARPIDCDNRCEENPVAKVDHWEYLNYSYIWYVRYQDTNYNLYQGEFYIPSVETLKNELMDGPVPVGMAAFNDFGNYYGINPYEPETFTYVGLHAVLIVGWDDSEKVWICRNSWGDEWGNDGNFTIPWVEESFDIREYDYTPTCGGTLCICNATLFGFDGVQVIASEFASNSTTTSTMPTTTSSSTSSSTTTTIIEDFKISGMVVGDKGGFVRGLSNVKVVLERFIEGAQYSITDDLGKFEFDKVKEGQCLVYVEDERKFDPSAYEFYLEGNVILRFQQKESEKCIITLLFKDSYVVEYCRIFRDEFLSKSTLGISFINLYLRF